MGLLMPSERGIIIDDFILVRQETGPASVSLDMDWWADKQIELFDRFGIEPWQTSCWCHTHPAGVNGPSPTDEETMEESFGGWDFIVMLILTKAGYFYARIDVDHDFGSGVKQRLSVPCTVEIDWAKAGKEAINTETIARWEEEFKQCVSESEDPWLIFDDGPHGHVARRSGNGIIRPDHNTQMLGDRVGGKEMKEYVDACQSVGFDPNDPENFEDYFGYQPNFG